MNRETQQSYVPHQLYCKATKYRNDNPRVVNTKQLSIPQGPNNEKVKV